MNADLLKPGEGTQFPITSELRRRALALLQETPTDEVIPYAKITAALGVAIEPDRRARGAFLAAGRDLLLSEKRGIENVKNVGYRIYRDDEHRRMAGQRERRAVGNIKRALEILRNTAMDNLPPAEVALLFTDQARLAIVAAVHKKLKKTKALPAPAEVSVPKGADLVRFVTKKREEEK